MTTTKTAATPSRSPLPIVVLISGGGSNLQAIIDHKLMGKLPVDIRAVISNVPTAQGLEHARRAGINTVVIDHTQYDTREAFDAELESTIDAHDPALVVLAGFMRLLSDDFVRHYHGRMLNIHPSLLPEFKGLNTHQRALDAYHAGKLEQHGASVHFVTPELDGGPVILQASVPIKNNDTVESLAARVLVKEHQIYPTVIRWFAEGRLKLQDDQVIFDGETLDRPISFDSIAASH
ncbi:phosphoribosylglycinamide formyltransferase [Kaarinaea lacus]